MHQVRPDQAQSLRRDAALQAAYLLAKGGRKLHSHKTSDSGHRSTLPRLAEVTEFL